MMDNAQALLQAINYETPTIQLIPALLPRFTSIPAANIGSNLPANWNPFVDVLKASLGCSPCADFQSTAQQWEVDTTTSGLIDFTDCSEVKDPEGPKKGDMPVCHSEHLDLTSPPPEDAMIWDNYIAMVGVDVIKLNMDNDDFHSQE